jgi:hypothetical protein
MPWPEKTLLTRLLAGLVGAVAGAFVGFIFVFGNYFTMYAPTSIVLYAMAGGALIGFLVGLVRA